MHCVGSSLRFDYIKKNPQALSWYTYITIDIFQSFVIPLVGITDSVATIQLYKNLFWNTHLDQLNLGVR